MDENDRTDDRTDDRWYEDARGRVLLDPRALYGLELRYVLTDVIASAPGRVWTVAELVQILGRTGFVLAGRPSKIVSDHLRAEVARGRVVRVGRGRYRMGVIPGTTRRRIRRAARHRAELVAWAPSWPVEGAAGSLDP